MREAYGRVYTTIEPFENMQDGKRKNGGVYVGHGFRAVLWREGVANGMLFEGPIDTTPEQAFDRLEAAAKKHGVVDIKPWSGDVSALKRRVN